MGIYSKIGLGLSAGLFLLSALMFALGPELVNMVYSDSDGVGDSRDRDGNGVIDTWVIQGGWGYSHHPAQMGIETSSGSGILDRDGNGDLGITIYVNGRYVDNNNNGEWDVCEDFWFYIEHKPDVNPDFRPWDWQANEFDIGNHRADEFDGEFYYEVNPEYDGCESHPMNTVMSEYVYKDIDNDGTPDELSLVKVGRACLGCYEGAMIFNSAHDTQDEDAYGNTYHEGIWVVYDDEFENNAYSTYMTIFLSGGTSLLLIVGFLWFRESRRLRNGGEV